MSQPTTERLALALTAAGCPPEMIERARAGFYDDFKSPIANPISQLVQELRSIGQTDLVNRAIDGEFDATDEESDLWFETEGKHFLPDPFVDALRSGPKGFGNRE